METVIFAPDLIEYAFKKILKKKKKLYSIPFPFRRKIYGRRVLKWITQRLLLTFAFVKLLAFGPLFNAPKKHVLNYFALEMAAIVVAGGGTAENRERVVEGR